MENCELCNNEGGILLWRGAICRVVRVAEPEFADYPGFLRVILERHVSEMTELSAPERGLSMEVVFACERLVRELFRPAKVNLASLGNVVPHVHWHVIARHRNDRHFPDSIWSAPRRPARCDPHPVSDSLLAEGLRKNLEAVGTA